ncbi:hypothetical protein BpHYR1_000416 [Brachionus plicatilis]|uniref:CCHC-type domain-containing protein n=1 Tax=Brachionus plicatilis TaxID=10195 RepID=A0A3M7PUB7_BRAPC|nr:hypothetical protein BpHYR1_000416 [Brachionus plicatilis]
MNKDEGGLNLQRWKFLNALKVNTKVMKTNIKERDFLQILKSNLDHNAFSKITSVYCFYSNKIWIVEFDECIDVKQFFNKEILLDSNNKVTIEDPNSNKTNNKTTILRFHRLPSNLTNQAITNFLNGLKFKELKILDIKNEHHKNFPSITNGVKRVKISYPLSIENQVQAIAGPIQVAQIRTIITIAGQKPSCYFCMEQGHSVKECKLKQTACSNCHLTGHCAAKCNIVERIKSMERSKVDYDDLFIEEEDKENKICKTNNQPTNPINATKDQSTHSSHSFHAPIPPKHNQSNQNSTTQTQNSKSITTLTSVPNSDRIESALGEFLSQFDSVKNTQSHTPTTPSSQIQHFEPPLTNLIRSNSLTNIKTTTTPIIYVKHTLDQGIKRVANQ